MKHQIACAALLPRHGDAGLRAAPTSRLPRRETSTGKRDPATRLLSARMPER